MRRCRHRERSKGCDHPRARNSQPSSMPSITCGLRSGLSRKALAVDPDDPRAHDNLGALWLNRKTRPGQRRMPQVARTESGEFSHAQSSGNGLDERGRLDEAFQPFEKAAELNPDDASAQINLANIRRARKRDSRLWFLARGSGVRSRTQPADKMIWGSHGLTPKHSMQRSFPPRKRSRYRRSPLDYR